jgi:hypothetical protein
VEDRSFAWTSRRNYDYCPLRPNQPSPRWWLHALHCFSNGLQVPPTASRFTHAFVPLTLPCSSAIPQLSLPLGPRCARALPPLSLIRLAAVPRPPQAAGSPQFLSFPRCSIALFTFQR